MINLLAQQRCTVVDSQDDAYAGKHVLLSRRAGMKPAAEVDPQRISGVDIQQKQCGAPKDKRLNVGTTHLGFLLVSTGTYRARTARNPGEDCLSVIFRTKMK